ncbi:MAG: hydrogen gas-evolving membrane-bound hydrogenase subunit E [Cyclobacteriaceae bacterium]
MAFIIVCIFLTALLTPFIYNKSKVIAAVLLMLILGAANFVFFSFLPEIKAGNTISETYNWIPDLGINLSFYLDGLGLFFALLVLVIGILVVFYSLKYMKGYPHESRFFAYLLFFMGSMLGVVLSANLISLFVFWELTSLSSFFLIGFNNTEEKSRYASRQALLITAGGGLALMAGFILIYLATGSYSMLEVLKNKEALHNSPMIAGTIILLLAGAFTKSAQFPFHFWLPNAMAAPTPVSAYLHSATMVKAGVYLVFRFNPILADIVLWQQLLTIFGAFTMIFAAFKAIRADDLKRMLAFTTTSALGIFFMMIGAGSKAAINGAIIYVMAHAIYKGALFLIAGNVDHEAGTRKISQLSGLARKMPYTAIAAVAASISMAGLIPSKGFVGKEILYDALLHFPGNGIMLLVLLFIASAFFVVISILIGYKMLFGSLKPAKAHEASIFMYLPPVILGILGLLLAIFPKLISQPLLAVATENVMGAPTELKIKLWHGFNLVFWLSVATLAVGFIIYFLRNLFLKFWQRHNFLHWLDADKIYKTLVNGTGSLAHWLTEFIQNGYLRNYISVFISVFSGLIIYLYFTGRFNLEFIHNSWQNLAIFEVAILILVIIAILVLFTTRSRLIVVATLTIIGYGMALAYALFSAPDVAMTQFLAESLMLIMLILILHRLPGYVISGLKITKKYLITSIVFGVLMMGISLMMLSKEVDSKLKEYFISNSVSKGKGENVVNVILVDFRALDTLGEITVLGITMIGIIALLTVNVKRKK